MLENVSCKDIPVQTICSALAAHFIQRATEQTRAEPQRSTYEPLQQLVKHSLSSVILVKWGPPAQDKGLESDSVSSFPRA